ncbi:MAG: ABC transporter permease [Acidimicrobiales bacterium]|jgi:simple sugar transport system permease protein
MSESDAGPGSKETAPQTDQPVAGGAGQSPEPASETAASVFAPKGSNVANSLLNAVLEGSSAVVTILAIFVAIVIGGLLIAFTSPVVLHAWSHVFSAPGNAFAKAWDVAASAYSAMFEGAIINPHTITAAFHGGSTAAIFNPLSETAVNATPLILAGLAVALAFRAGLFNIGATGQFIGGAMIAGWIGFALHLPMIIHVVVAVIGGFVGGAIVGSFVGDLKARTGAHEVIVTIMLNYVMEFLILFLLGLTVFRAAGSPNPISPPVLNNAMLPHLAGANLRINAGFLVALAAAAAIAWLLGRTTLGFELRTVGANQSAARAAGMSPERTWVRVMAICGGLAGLAGASVVLGTDFALTPQIYGTYGIDAITVALLGRAKPSGVVLAALLYGSLNAGSVTMQAQTQIPVDIATVIQALIVLFVAAPPFVREIFHLRARRAGADGQLLAKGWSS